MIPVPADIGAPLRFTRWRRNQSEAVLFGADSKKRFVVQGAPTGFGKSLTYICQGLLTDARTVILTSTKALQSQLLTDFHESGLIEIRGLGSYDCVEGGPTGRFGDYRREGFRAERGLSMTCDEAPCQSGAWCPKREGGCLYYDAYRKANLPTSRLLVTNYAYWMSINKYGEGLGQFDLLVLDEAHNAKDELGSFVGTELRPHEVEAILPGEARALPPGSDIISWRAWGMYWAAAVQVALDNIKAAIKESERTGTNKTGELLSYGALRRAKELRRTLRKLQTIATMQGDWVIDYTTDNHRRPLIKFDPVWPGEYAERNLFLGIHKVVLVSATVTPKTAEVLGISPAHLDYREYPSTFNKKNRPVIYIPTAAMNRTSAAAGKFEWHQRIDQIIGRRPNYKGIIHTVSYPRAAEVFAGSEYRERMLTHDSLNTKEVIARFKASREPLILVSPVLDTGYDFPGDQCRYQIVAKMPFPVTVDKIVKARAERDKQYRDYETMIKLVQIAGRIVRSEDDWGETIIIDNDFAWWFDKVGRFMAPKWFVESVRLEQMLWMPITGAAL